MLRRDFVASFTSIALFFTSDAFAQLCRNNTISTEEMELMGLSEPSLCGDFFCLRNEAYEAFREMSFEAEKDGLKLWCSSAYRNFFHQKKLWNAKYNLYEKQGLKGDEIISKIMHFSSVPGTSRHHWGTDIDIIDALAGKVQNALQEKNYKPHGEYQYLKFWLNANAGRFGFVEVYTNDENRSGFKYEPWHYSYLPLSKSFLHLLLKIDFSKVMQLSECKGLENIDNTFFESYKKEYLLGINSNLI